MNSNEYLPDGVGWSPEQDMDKVVSSIQPSGCINSHPDFILVGQSASFSLLYTDYT